MSEQSAEDFKPRIGWIGTGVMGTPMCEHLVNAGYTVTVYNRTKDKAEALLKKGARWAESPKTLTKASDVIFTIVGFPDDVREVYFGDEGILAGAREGRVLIDMTTTQPALAREIFSAAKPRGVDAIDAPVSGGDVGARNGTLSIMIGGAKAAVKKAWPLFEILGKTITYEGPAGSGQNTKMCNQIVIAGTMIGVCESLIYAKKAGLDLDTMLKTIQGGAAACWALDNLAPRVVKGDFAPGFMVEHFIKDMGIALDEARRMGLSLPGLSLVHQLYLAVEAQGHGRDGTQALYHALEKLCHMDK